MAKHRYGVVLDAGSSGTRLYVYKWLDNERARKHATDEELLGLPELETKDKWTTKIRPGISTFNENPSAAGPYLQDLLDQAMKIVPHDQIADTPFFLLATAGMRLLKPTERNAILDAVCAYVRSRTSFLISDCASHIQVIDGNTEGLYGWISANYLLGAFNQPDKHDHGGDHHTYGFLDMGGASAQIAFAPNSTESAKHSNDLTLLRLRSIGGTASEYQVFVHSWLGFGVHQARDRYLEHLLEAMNSTKTREYPDPCLPAGLRMSTTTSIILSDVEAETWTDSFLQGTGKFEECLAATYPLLGKEVVCDDNPCLFNGVHVPAIDFGVNHFVGVSEYWHTTHQIFESGHDEKAYDFQTYQQRVNQFCSQSWPEIQAGVKKHEWGKKIDEDMAAETCFKASWLINVLHDGIGIPRAGIEAPLSADDKHNTTKVILDAAEEKGFLAPFQAVNDIGKMEVSWTLGKMVLYSSSQISPVEIDGLPVGFGSNVKGIPSDFQYPGGSASAAALSDSTTSDHSDPLSSADDDLDGIDTDTDSDDEDWKHKLLHSDLGGRAPGFIFFLLIVVIAGLLLCGRDRRANLFRKINPWSKSGPSGGSSSGFSPKRRRGNGFASKLPAFLGGHTDGASSGRYERVLEEGDLVNPGDFELHDISDEETLSSRSSGSSGIANANTGRMRMTPRPGSSTPGQRPGIGLSGGSGYFSESLNRTTSNSSLKTAQSGQGLGLNLETNGAAGARSNIGSPTRFRSPGLGNKETVD